MFAAAILAAAFSSNGYAATATGTARPTEGPAATAEARDLSLFGAESAATPAPSETAVTDWIPSAAGRSGEAVPENPLTIGGQFYLRAGSAVREDSHAAGATLSLPMLVDGYFDARPNERVRAFLLARLSHDPTTSRFSATALGVSGTAASNPASATSIVLDQLWMRFDAGRSVFFTAGKQHVKWGAARFWNPNDFLHLTPRDPLAQFDARSGLSMVKVHIPWEKRGWNLYGIGYVDETAPTGMVSGIGGAARAEAVIGTGEIGIDVAGQLRQKPRLGADLSFPLGPFDVYVEGALRRGSLSPLWRFREVPDLFLGPAGLFEAWQPTGWTHAITAGANWQVAYSDQDSVTVGVEYSHNSIGYTDPRVYPWLLLQGRFTPFYLARRYGAVYVMLPAPGSWNNTTFVLSTIGNLSDSSYVTRLDFLATVLTNLRVEVYGGAHYGTREGEFRLGFDIPAQYTGGQRIVIPPLVGELGIGLRVSM